MTAEPDGTPLIVVERVGVEEDIALIRLNRPAKLNALSQGMERELLAAVHSELVDTAAAVVFVGSERAFSAGADTTEFPEMTPERIARYYRESGSVYSEIAAMPQPTIAAISGYCLGAGFELALACDIRVADSRASFGLPEVGLGILPSSGGVTRLVRAAGPAVARDIILFGEPFGARRAYEIGVLRECVDEGAALSTAVDWAQYLAKIPPLALAWTKAAIDAAAESSTAVSLLVEQLAYASLNRNEV